MREDVMTFLSQTLIPNLFPENDYSGQALSWRYKLFSLDGVSFRLGPVRVRQIRVNPG
jgi:hypothetical protein